MSAAAKTAREVFVAAVKLAPEAWDAYLKEHCGDDDELRCRVEALLKSHVEAGSFLGKPVPERLAEELALPASSDATKGEAAADEGRGDDLAFLAPSEKPDSLGRLGHYEILQVIGRGGMGIVLRAFDEKLRRVVAIKVMAAQLATNGTARKRFSREAQAAAAVSHDHIVTIHAVDEANGIPYLVMQFIDGVSLQERLDKSGPLQLHEILRIGMQTASGLGAAHAQGLIHRDIKPANILLENGVERVKITDFGLARAMADANLTQSGVVAGTPQYMAPEQASAEALDARTDLFSLGSVLYAMCTGRAPFRGSSSMAVLKRVCEETPPPIRESNPENPDWLVAIIDKLHAKDPAQRYESAAEVAELLGRHLAHVQHPSLTPLSPLGTGAESEGRPHARPRHRLAIVAAVLLCFIAGLSLSEATRVTNLRATVIRIFTPQATVEGDGAPAQITAKAEKGAFVLLAAGKERDFDTLAEAVQGADNGATVEIRGNGPFVSQPIKITRPINIRAGVGVRPVIQLSPEAVQTRANLFATAAPLSLEGLELQLVAQLSDERQDPWQSIVLAKGPLFIANCRLLFKQLRGTVVESYGPICELRNCEVICPTGNWIAAYHQPHIRVNIDNCCLTTGIITHYGRYGAVDYTKESTVRSTRSTFVTQNQPFSFLVYTDKVPGLWTKDQRVTPVRLATEGNIWDTRTSVLLFGQTPSGKVLPPGEAEASLPKLLAWHGARNLYAVDGAFLGLGIIPREHPAPAKPIRSVAEWGNYWGMSEVESIEGRVRYQGGDLLSRLAVAPEKLTAEDFRLADGSPGKSAGRNGKDLGADIDLVGPGPSYERWKKTPEYQQWLNDSEQVTAAGPETEPKAFVRLGGKGVAERQFDILADAVQSAGDGDTIEIRGNGPFVTGPIVVWDKALVIRAGPGVRPVLKPSPAALEANEFFLARVPLVLEGIEIHWPIAGQPRRMYLRNLVTSSAALSVAHCRMIVTGRTNTIYVNSEHCELRNCEFFLDQAVSESVGWKPRKTSRLIVDGCIIAGVGVSLELGAGGAPVETSSFQFTRNSTTGGTATGLYRFTAVPDGKRQLSLRSADNVIGSRRYMVLANHEPVPQQTPAAAEMFVKSLLSYDEQRNVYDTGTNLLAYGQRTGGLRWLPLVQPASDIASWHTFWGLEDTKSQIGAVRFEGGQLDERVIQDPYGLTPADFRLADSSPGKGAGNDGKDLGADINLVGPGPAYERWKKTPEYQQWLKETGQVKK